MYYDFSPRDNANRSTLKINGRKIGRVHFRDNDAWLNPYKNTNLKSKPELEKLGFRVEADPNNSTYPKKVYLGTNKEDEIAKALEKAFYDI